jgi:O-antigen/teichoic acid export membrane protein
MIWFIPGAVGIVLFPKTAADWDTATHFTPPVARITGFVTMACAVGLAILGLPVIRVLYGRAYLPAFAPLLALLPGIVCLSVGKVLAGDLAGRGKPHYGTASAVCGLVMTLVLDLVLVPRIGIVGAGIASSIAYATSSSVLVLLYVRLSGNKPGTVLFINRSDLERSLGTLSGFLREAGARM